MDIVVGTAGHIDHGKTALIKALTGTDTDRLPEEKRRGITVDLGFAEMTIGDVHFGFVDVPGHERFVRNMVAGASGIDLVMLVIAADEGVMPQTREHFDICRLLGVKGGIVVLTKIDMVDADTRELARIDAAELVGGSFLEGARIIPASARTGEGIDELKEALADTARGFVRPRDERIAHMPVDRSFSMKGFGAVVTGTLLSGEFLDGSDLELLPTGRLVRVRGLQSHGRPVPAAYPGQRVAVNLAGIDHREVARGMMLAEAAVLQPTQLIDARIEAVAGARKPLRTRQRVRVHIGTAEVIARLNVLETAGEIAPGETGFAQLRLEAPVAAIAGERVILRSYSPQYTIAGGVVIDSLPAKHRAKERDMVRSHLESLVRAGDDPAANLCILIESSGTSGLTRPELAARTALRGAELEPALDAMIAAAAVTAAGGRYVATEHFNAVKKTAARVVEQLHARDPLSRGAARAEVHTHLRVPAEVFESVLTAMESEGSIIRDRETVRLASHSSRLDPEEEHVVATLRHIFRDARLEVPKLDDAISEAMLGQNMDRDKVKRLLTTLVDAGEVVKVTDEFYFSRDALDELIAKLRAYSVGGKQAIDVPAFKQLAGVSRKYAIPLLEYFDREKITQRVGETRRII